MNESERRKVQDRVLLLTLFIQVLLLLNNTVTLYVLSNQAFKASMVPTQDGEKLQVHIDVDTGRPRGILDRAVRYLRRQSWVTSSWLGAWLVGGVERTSATVDISITVTGTNVASTATVDYYIEGRETGGAGAPYRFLEGNGIGVTVGGAALDLSNQTTIESHLAAMGLSTEESHTVDYYVYVEAEATGAVSGETLTSEITETKFDTVAYQYGTEATLNFLADGLKGDGFVYHDQEQGGVYWYSNADNTLMFGEYQNAADNPKRRCRGASEYDITNLPDTADVTNTIIEYTGVAHNPGASNADIVAYEDVHAVDVNTVGEAQTLYWDIGNSTDVFVSNDATFPEIGSGKTVDLGTGADSYIESRTGDNWVGIGFRTQGTEDTEPWDDNYHELGARNGGDYIILKVTYLSFGASWYPLPPMSLASLPITLDVVALSALIAATILVWRENRRKMS